MYVRMYVETALAQGDKTGIARSPRGFSAAKGPPKRRANCLKRIEEN